MKEKYIEGSGQFSGLKTKLQKRLALLLFVILGVSGAQGQVTVSGAVVGNGSYFTLSEAFTAIGTSQTGANINITVTGNITERNTAILGAGDWTSLAIRPSGGVWTISGLIAADLIRFDGADNVIINGLNSGGNGLILSNTNNSAMSGISTVKFINDASNNTITNCTLLGSASVSTSTPGGVVFFSTGTNTGNDNNTISNCKIGPAGGNLPSKLIFSLGTNTTATHYNSGNTITGCELYDYYLNTGCAAIYLSTSNTDWTISNNKIYQTGTRNFTVTTTMYGINFSNSTNGNNIQITGNTIGYANELGTGTFSMTGSGSFIGIYLFASNSSPDACNVTNNTIANVSLTSGTGLLYGIQNATQAATNTINLNNNSIRNLTATNTTGGLIGIFAGAAESLDCSNNTITNLSRNAAGAFYGIQYSSPVTVTFDSNTITNLNSTAADNGGNILAGIYSNNAPQIEQFFTNTITGLTSASTTSGINIYGISSGSGTIGNKSFIGNTIGNFSLPASGTGKIHGIKLNGVGTLNRILGNTIHTLTGGNIVNGIFVNAGTTNKVSKNKIYGLSSPATAAVVNGMTFTGGTTHDVYNNLIGNLTASAGNNASGTPNQVVGINAATSTAANLNLYNNTIRIDASSTGANFGTSTVNVDANTTLTMLNNVLVNTSVANGTGLSVVFRKPTLTGYDSSSNNNLFYGTAIYTDGTNTDASLAAYKTRVTPRDAASISESPYFTSTVGTDVGFLHVNPLVATQINGGGTTIATVTEDIDGDVRNATTPDIGADEFNQVACTAAVGGTTPAQGTACMSGTTTIVATGYSAGTGSSYHWESSSNAAFTTPVAIGSASPLYANLTTPALTTTTYFRLVVTCAAGIPSYSTVTMVTVTPNVTSTFAQIAPICSGATSSPLPTTSNEGIVGTWSPAFNNTTTTTYTFTPNAGQCGTTATMTVTVNTTPAPTGNSPQNFTTGQTLTDLSVAGTNIIWYASASNAATATNPLPGSTPLVDGVTYYATQTVSGCVSTTSLAVQANLTLGAVDFTLSNLKVYPNPVSSLLQIESTDSVINVEMYNVAGQKVMSKSVNAMATTISMSGFGAGTYFVKVFTDEAVKTVKVIKR